MHTLEITIQRKSGAAWPVVVEYSSTTSAVRIYHQASLQLDRVALRAEPSPKEYGIGLGRALFFDEVRTALREASGRHPEPLHVLLFVDDDELRGDRWERLCANLDEKDQWDFLGVSQRLPFSLYLRSPVGRSFPPLIAADLRALLVAASPGPDGDYGLKWFDTAVVLDGLERALGEDIPRDRLETGGALDQSPTLDLLCRRLTEGRYTILHVVCHGQMVDKEPTLFLARPKAPGARRPANPDSILEPVPAGRLVSRLRTLGDPNLPQLVFLVACESAAAGVDEALGGLAARLVREVGLPAVVAMTDRVSVGTALALAESFYRCFRKHGEVDRALAEARAGLAERADVSVAALFTRLRGQPLFYPDREPPLSTVEIDRGLQRLRDYFPERAPVLVGRLEELAVALGPALESAAPDRVLAALDGLCEEVLEIGFRELARGGVPDDYNVRCPFRGLYPFRTEDAEFFFGREELVERLRGRLAEHPFLAVVGASGSGKSSLVLAGLIPQLRTREPDLSFAYLTPGADPPARLHAAMREASRPPGLVVVDQFEEVFTLCTQKETRREFLDALRGLAQRTRVVLTLRAEFYGECASDPSFAATVQEHHLLVGPMHPEELQSAMREQARVVGLRFEADLAGRIFDDVQAEAGAMPLLQHALLELWKRRHGRWLRAEEYRALGGVRRAIAETAEALHRTLPEAERLRLRHILIRLTRLSQETGLGGEWRDTARRVPTANLVPVGQPAAPTRALLERLADVRLVVIGLNAATGQDEVVPAHEALIRHWPRLRNWLEADRETLELREGIGEDARRWLAKGRPDSLLLHFGLRLRQARDLVTRGTLSLNDLESSYLEACAAFWSRYGPRFEEEPEQGRHAPAPTAAVAANPTASRHFADLEIGLYRWDATSYAIDLRYTPPDGQDVVQPMLPSPVVQFDLDKLGVEVLDPEAYGKALSADLFAAPNVRSAFAEACASARALDVPLRVRLAISPSLPQLHNLRWETLRDPADGSWLLTQEQTLFSRYLVSPDFRPVRRRPKGSLQALVVIANPTDLTRWIGEDRSPLAPVDVPGELQRAQAALQGMTVTELAGPGQATLDKLLAGLRDGCDVLYLVAHGAMQRGEVRLYLEKADGQVDLVVANELVMRMRDLRELPRLAVLVPCQSAGAGGDVRTRDAGALSALGPRLAEAGVPAVLAMQDNVLMRSMAAFLPALFADLRQHGEIDRAVAVARRAIRDPQDSWKPTLFMRLRSGKLWHGS
jgi:energy-coupling factor transporter ATP-binding protein EcfA2